jgi:hypothetical protein
MIRSQVARGDVSAGSLLGLSDVRALLGGVGSSSGI